MFFKNIPYSKLQLKFQPSESDGSMTVADLVDKALDSLAVDGDDSNERSIFLKQPSL
jgi:hypothetical protein